MTRRRARRARFWLLPHRLRPHWAGWLCAAAALAASAPAEAQTAGPGGTPSGSAPTLDRLLKLPDSVGYDVERRGGASRSEWRARYHEAQESLDVAKTGLAEAQEELSQTASQSDAWSVAPPGLPAEASSSAQDATRLREQVKRQRAEVERAERHLRELDIEANLAGVPPDWREPRTETGAGNDSVPGTPSPR
jgi:hypothetical protein